MEERDRALVELGQALRSSGYHFTTVTPATHERVFRRRQEEAADLRDVFGWSRPFRAGLLPPALHQLLVRAEALQPHGALFRSAVRFSSLGPHLFVHDGWPTEAKDAVFFGPDTYRFASWLQRRVEGFERLFDVGCGTGAGGIVLAPRGGSVVLGEVNARALRFARINAVLAGAVVELRESDLLAGVEGSFDLVVANPPYLADARGRSYRDGGGELGTGLAVRITREALERLRPGGRLLLYAGAPVVEGADRLRAALAPHLAAAAHWRYEELDPDVFGEELEQPGYAAVERIAVVTLEAVAR
ncbi:methyltransferase [Vulgatibacter sp.]|uniref:methyltransferase n=1 Tax=Vulgatibacter sp. TaxID=1971226 RepID=UPI0035616F74